MGSFRDRHGRHCQDHVQQVRIETLDDHSLSLWTWKCTPLLQRPIANANARNSSQDFYEVMDMLDKRLNDKGKNWRHVLKSLKVLDYCLHEGSELVVTWARKNIYVIKTLREFIHLDDEGRDVGAASKLSQLFKFVINADNSCSSKLRKGTDLAHPRRRALESRTPEPRTVEVARGRTCDRFRVGNGR